MNETGRRVREQYADTGGFTDHVFAACSILGYAFVPRIRDLPSKRLYVFERWSAASNWVSDSQRYHEQSRSDPRIRTPQTFQSGKLAGNV